MAKCLNLQDIIVKEEDIVVKGEREENLKIILNTAKYNDDHQAKILEQYEMFKLKVKDILEKGNENNEVLKRFEHLLFQTHACSTECDKKCPDKGKIVEPRVLIPMKLLHLFLKEPALYQGLKEFFHLYLRCLLKTHAQGVAESMGSTERKGGRECILKIWEERPSFVGTGPQCTKLTGWERKHWTDISKMECGILSHNSTEQNLWSFRERREKNHGFLSSSWLILHY